MSRRRELARERELLVLRADLQRLQLRVHLQEAAQQLSTRGWALRAWGVAREHPSVWLLGVAALVAARRAGWRDALARGLVVWRAWDVARRWLRMKGMR